MRDVREQLREFSRSMVESLPEIHPETVADPVVGADSRPTARSWRPIAAVVALAVAAFVAIPMIVFQGEPPTDPTPPTTHVDLLSYLECGDGQGSLRLFGAVADENGNLVGVSASDGRTPETAINPFTEWRMGDLLRVAGSESLVIFVHVVDGRTTAALGVVQIGRQWVAAEGAFCSGTLGGRR